MPAPATISAYIASFPEATQLLLLHMREAIRAAAPEATEAISYAMPTFKLNSKNLVHFAGYERHIGFYPGAGGMAAFGQEMAGYKHAKGSVQFPLDQPLPLDLVARITQFRVKQETEKAEAKKRRKASVVKY